MLYPMFYIFSRLPSLILNYPPAFNSPVRRSDLRVARSGVGRRHWYGGGRRWYINQSLLVRRQLGFVNSSAYIYQHEVFGKLHTSFLYIKSFIKIPYEQHDYLP